ncbi:SRR1-like protein isoform X2 [Ambystoma mexicanum]|uniref:SRR1-like protein isoform X2 n=1 Tax=Ambystoma mexicanum TaxID=8296 RepID=UPI0037E8FDBA
MSGAESADWQTVCRKKGAKNKIVSRMLLPVEPDGAADTCKHDCQNKEDDFNRILQKIHQTKEELKTSGLWDSCQNTIQECFIKCLKQVKQNPANATDETCVTERQCNLPEPGLQHVAQNDSNKQVDHFWEGQNPSCVCYGVGQFSACVISRYQLGFLLLMLEKLQIQKCHCHVFDPLFSGPEIEVLKTLGLSVILENEEGKRSIVSPTVFYMIHCGKALYNNLLWKNWSVDILSKVVIIGNSFQGFEQRLPSRIFLRDYAYISKVHTGYEGDRRNGIPRDCSVRRHI